MYSASPTAAAPLLPPAVRNCNARRRGRSPGASLRLWAQGVYAKTAGKQQLLRTGGGFSRIHEPDGAPLGTPMAENEEGLVIAEIDLGMISLARAAADPSDHYSRPDVTRLLLDKTRREPVVFQRALEPTNSVETDTVITI